MTANAERGEACEGNNKVATPIRNCFFGALGCLLIVIVVATLIALIGSTISWR